MKRRKGPPLASPFQLPLDVYVLDVLGIRMQYDPGARNRWKQIGPGQQGRLCTTAGLPGYTGQPDFRHRADVRCSGVHHLLPRLKAKIQ
jgi:hypothetical protein